jgi:hypothetical protein
LGSGFGAGFSSGAVATAAVSGFGGAGAGFTLFVTVPVVLVFAGVTVAVFEGTCLLPQLLKITAAKAINTISDLFNIPGILSLLTKNYADEI